MKKNFWLLMAAALLVVSGALVGCNSGGTTKTETKPKKTETRPDLTTTPSMTEPGATEARKSASVEISNFVMNPDKVTIVKGGKVTWTNKDSVEHTVTADDGSFDSGQLATDKAFSKTFDAAGSYDYHCSNHPSMTGTVEVK